MYIINLKMIKYTFDINCLPHDFTSIRHFLNLSLLADHRYSYYNVSFFSKTSI